MHGCAPPCNGALTSALIRPMGGTTRANRRSMGGHDGQTANTFVCLERSRRCVLLLANDVRAEASFADLVRFVLGETGVPYDWEYAGQAGKS
jgi:hypothetical protein